MKTAYIHLMVKVKVKAKEGLTESKGVFALATLKNIYQIVNNNGGRG